MDYYLLKSTAFISLVLHNINRGGVFMAKTVTINLQIEAETKTNAEALFSSFGISVTDAINIFLNTSIMEGGFPFQIKQPRYNRETELAILEARRIMNGSIESKGYNSLSELISELDDGV